ncbi:MAG TPA: tetratricopeptide repeat protein, partial [Burkholderiales bacterium]|nr:tetratricopeptide repeat protein [Burkholderiales bacterium]
MKQPIHLNTDLDQARARFVEGVEHFEAGRPEAARVAFEAALALAPGRASVLANLGATHLALGQWRDALDVLQRAAAADASQPDVWRNLGLAHKELGHWQAAADCLKRSLEAEPHAGLLLVLGQVQLKLGQVQAALSSFDRALEIDASFTPAWSERGSLLRELNRLDEAARSFEKAMELGADPELHAYYLASVRNASRNGMQNAAIPATSPRLYVEALFDQYAADFQRHAVEDLRYQGFQTLLRPLLEGGRRYGAVLDLGCGSGLCG